MCQATDVTTRRPGDRGGKIGSPESGDGWVADSSGTRYWGKFGAAGLLALDVNRRVLLQHRVEWSHHGGTWGIPGGARHRTETAFEAALREAAEEAAVPAEAIEPIFEHVLDLKFWSYTTVVARVVTPFEAEVTDPESNELRWVPLNEVHDLELHPGFASAWPELKQRIVSTLNTRDAGLRE